MLTAEQEGSWGRQEGLSPTPPRASSDSLAAALLAGTHS